MPLPNASVHPRPPMVVPRLLLQAVVALAFLVALYYFADWRAVFRGLVSVDPRYLTAGLLLFIPQLMISAARWQLLTRRLVSIRFSDAMRHTMAANAVNLALPAKLGDFYKTAFIAADEYAGAARASMLVVVEKLADVAALCGLWFCGWMMATNSFGVALTSFVVVTLLVWPRLTGVSHELLGLCVLSMALWVLHLAQIQLFMQAAGVFVPWQTTWARVPAAIFAGLAPISLWGMGTRDAAMVWLYSDTAPAATMAAVGLLMTLRYLVPGVLGIPWLVAAPGRRRGGRLFEK